MIEIHWEGKMTEAEWQSCTNAGDLLALVWNKASLRKKRRFLYACFKPLWELSQGSPQLIQRSRQILQFADRVAEGLASAAEEDEAWDALVQAHEDMVAKQRSGAAPAGLSPGWAFGCLLSLGRPGSCDADPRFRYGGATGLAVGSPWGDPGIPVPPSLIRDLFGNPFQPVRVNPLWLTPVVIALARGVYEDRAFDRLPILADALEEAGCDNAAILSHCREPGEHVRGCWVLDLVRSVD
jgi:hypothetical protein